MAKSKVKKRNRVLTIDKFELDSYLEQGYDEIDTTTGEVVKKATGGRMVSLAEHNKVLDELEGLKQSNTDEVFSELQNAFQELSQEKDDLVLEFNELKKENAGLKGQVKLQNTQKEVKK